MSNFDNEKKNNDVTLYDAQVKGQLIAILRHYIDFSTLYNNKLLQGKTNNLVLEFYSFFKLDP